MDGLFPPDAAPRAAAPGVYRVLARKYRPATFEDLIGQEPMVRTLSNAFQIGRIAQGYMLTGVRGVGKTTTARILARALNYEIPGKIDRPTIDMPELGIHCKAIMEGRHVDVIEMDAASHTSINDIREITDASRYKPVSARTKVYIIDEVHMLSTAAFNGLLKTLEEPPEHVKFIFATTEIRKVPVTVLSRCQRFDLRRIETEVLIRHLAKIAVAETVEIDDEALKLVARAAEGSVRDGLSLLDQAIAHGEGRIEAAMVREMLGLADRARVIDLFEHVMRGEAAAALAEIRAQYDVGADPAVVIADLAEFVHLVTRLKLVPEAADDAAATEDERVRGRFFAEGLSLRVLSRAWQMLLKGFEEVKQAPRALAAAEMLLVRLTHASELPTPDEALRAWRDGAVPGGSSGGGSAPRGSAPAPTASGPAAIGQMRSGAAMQRQPAREGEVEAFAPALAEPRVTPAAEVLGRAETAEPVPGPRLVASNETPTVRAARPKPALVLASLADVAALAAEKRDVRLKMAIERQMRPVGFEEGRIDVSLTPDAPHGLAQDLARKLTEWTGERWVVALSREEGGVTLAEERDAARSRLVADARADPLVAAVLKRFPGSHIVDVRMLVAEGAEDAAAPDAAPEPIAGTGEDDPGWMPDD
ncbi:DNA polymerase III subunit gamma/tau [Siculibacillus lacustris]|uniref:DNA polymerase III subunit gamma/tau n=1 Tax=Siculibacillus lacustris TaxID=1549641 RepID=A0A4Q9VKL5_9HYPH|nr:DNA polymerase III subunit gamma/tau [Siculibacillus lacustris]TBW35970.1 DNA polymerase III subunit gamma/tau [Siculibacillus lacustris]